MSALLPILVLFVAYAATRLVCRALDRLLGPLTAYVDDTGKVRYRWGPK